jgi:hypothetical protein
MLDTDYGDAFEFEELGCGQPAVARNHAPVTIDQDWNDKTEYMYAACDLLNLFIGVEAGVFGIDPERGNRNVLNCETSYSHRSILL